MKACASIYDFDSFAEYLRAYIQQRRDEGKAVSFEMLSRATGIKSASQIASYASGRRVPSASALVKLCKYLQLSLEEAEYAQTLVNLAKTRDEAVRKVLSAKLEALSRPAPKNVIDMATFARFTGLALPILVQLVNLKDFRADPTWIAERIGADMLGDKAAEALTLLTQLGVLVENVDGTLRAAIDGYEVPTELSNTVLRDYHVAAGTQALKALTELPVEDRFFLGLTTSIDATKLPDAREFLMDCLKRFDHRFSTQSGDQVLQMNLQLFRLV